MRPLKHCKWRLLAHRSVADRLTSAFIRSRLRLKALTCLVKIAQDEKLEKEYVRRYFLLMSGGVQDAAYSIRKEYITRLIQCLAPLKLPYHYNVFMFLAAHEPEPENISKVQIYVRSMFHRQPPSEWTRIV